jgi:hypothetical protein
MGNDILLGRLDVTPMLEGVQSVDSWFRATTGAGEFHMQVQFRPSKVRCLLLLLPVLYLTLLLERTTHDRDF